MMKALKNILLLFTILINTDSFAQVYHVNYDYDANGNRISRQIISVIKTSNGQANPDNFDLLKDAIVESVLSENGNARLAVFPNPVSNLLTIKHSSDINTHCTYTLTSLSGTLLEEGHFINLTELPMANLASGFYLLSITMKELEKTIQLKIVKQ